MRVQKGHTFAELIVIVLILAALTYVTVPRFQLGAIDRGQAERAAWEIVTALRRTRSLAISEAATNSDGFALSIQQTDTTITYEIVNCGSNDVVDSHAIDSRIDLSGEMAFEFGLLGALKASDDPTLEVTAADKTFTIRVIPATGMVKCVEN